MKKLIIALSFVFAAFTFSGCVAFAPSPVPGFLFTSVSGPMPSSITGKYTASKKGEGSCKSILGLIATGDCSVATAAQKAGITNIHHVDYSSTSILGIIASFTVTVYGE